VLDYDLEIQSALFRRWGAVLAPMEPDEGRSRDRGGPSVGVLGALAFLLALGGGLLWARRSGPTLPPEARTYVRLRESCRRAGLALTPGLTPLAMLERLHLWNAEAAVPASRVVDLYLRARYGGEVLGDSELREMSQALTATRRMLRVGRARGERGTKPKEVEG